jgi:hypothetical protein
MGNGAEVGAGVEGRVQRREVDLDVRDGRDQPRLAEGEREDGGRRLTSVPNSVSARNLGRHGHPSRSAKRKLLPKDRSKQHRPPAGREGIAARRAFGPPLPRRGLPPQGLLRY